MRALLAKISTALVAYGPLGVFLLGVLDSAGVPLPAAIDLLLLDVAVHSTHNPGHAYMTAFLAFLGSVAGNIALYQASRHGGRLFGRKQPSPGERGRFQDWFHRYGLLTVFVPAVVPFVPLPLKVFVISAGALQTPFVRFLGVIVLARVIRYFGMAWLALKLGADAQGFLIRNGWTIVGGILGAAVLLYAAMTWTARRREGRV